MPGPSHPGGATFAAGVGCSSEGNPAARAWRSRADHVHGRPTKPQLVVIQRLRCFGRYRHKGSGANAYAQQMRLSPSDGGRRSGLRARH